MPLKNLIHKRLGNRFRPRFAWKDAKLPESQLEVLTEIATDIQGMKKSQAGKGQNVSKSLKVLFSGPSGTGKTIASVLAKKVNLKLYQVDLGSAVNKYIGETEKNLNRVLEQAQTHPWILFFDEADALFGRRTSIKDSHDRYANQELSNLKSRLESFQGVIILSTNDRKNMDEAFLRKVDYFVEL